MGNWQMKLHVSDAMQSLQREAGDSGKSQGTRTLSTKPGSHGVGRGQGHET